MKYLIIFLFLLCMTRAAAASSCDLSLKKLMESKTLRAASYIATLIEKKILDEDTTKRLTSEKQMQLEDLRFSPEVSESRRVSVRASMATLFADAEIRNNWSEVSRLILQREDARKDKIDKVMEVNEKTRDLPSLVQIHSEKGISTIGKVIEHNGKTVIIYSKDKQIKYYDFELKKEEGASTWYESLPLFKTQEYQQVFLKEGPLYYYYDTQSRKFIINFKNQERVVAQGHEGNFSIYNGLAGKFVVHDNSNWTGVTLIPFDSGRQALHSNAILVHRSHSNLVDMSLVGNRQSLFLLKVGINNGAHFLDIYSAKEQKQIASVEVDFLFENAMGQQKSRKFCCEVLYKNEPHGVLVTNKGLKLINLNSWEINSLGEESFSELFMDMGRLDEHHFYSLSRKAGESGKTLAVYNFNRGLESVQQIALSSDSNIHSKALVKTDGRPYFVDFDNNKNQLTVYDILSGASLLTKKVEEDFKYPGPAVIAVTNSKNENFVILQDTVRYEKISIYELKNL